MEGLYGDESVIGAGSPIVKWRDNAARKFQYYLDKSTPHPVARWGGSVVAALLYCLRVYYVQGFYIVTYGLGIYILNLLIGFLSPQIDPESEGPALPTRGSDEFKPFIRRLPEFKFWSVSLSLFTTLCGSFPLHCYSECLPWRYHLLDPWLPLSSTEGLSWSWWLRLSRLYILFLTPRNFLE